MCQSKIGLLASLLSQCLPVQASRPPPAKSVPARTVGNARKRRPFPDVDVQLHNTQLSYLCAVDVPKELSASNQDEQLIVQTSQILSIGQVRVLHLWSVPLFKFLWYQNPRTTLHLRGRSRQLRSVLSMQTDGVDYIPYTCFDYGVTVCSYLAFWQGGTIAVYNHSTKRRDGKTSLGTTGLHV